MKKIPISINARCVACPFAFCILCCASASSKWNRPRNNAILLLHTRASQSGPLEVSWRKRSSCSFRSITAAILAFAYSIVIPRRSDTDEFHPSGSVRSTVVSVVTAVHWLEYCWIEFLTSYTSFALPPPPPPPPA